MNSNHELIRANYGNAQECVELYDVAAKNSQTYLFFHVDLYDVAGVCDTCIHPPFIYVYMYTYICLFLHIGIYLYVQIYTHTHKGVCGAV